MAYLWLDISMNHVFGMKVRECVRHLVHISCTPLLAKASYFAKLFVQLAMARKFENEEYSFFVVEISIET